MQGTSTLQQSDSVCSNHVVEEQHQEPLPHHQREEGAHEKDGARQRPGQRAARTGQLLSIANRHFNSCYEIRL